MSEHWKLDFFLYCLVCYCFFSFSCRFTRTQSSKYDGIIRAFEKSMSHRALELVEFLIPKSPMGENKLIHIGTEDDGGYVVWNDFDGCTAVYSFGIENETTFEEYLGDRGLNVFMFDYTVESPELKSENLKFRQIGISGESGKHPKLFSLEDILKLDGHSCDNNMLLKIDVEGWEWNVLEHTTVLDKFSQIVIEMHDMRQITHDDNFTRMIYALEKLNKTHQLIHIHANNCGHYPIFGSIPLPDVFEGTYIRRHPGLNFGSYDLSNLELSCTNNKQQAEYMLWFVEGKYDIVQLKKKYSD